MHIVTPSLSVWTSSSDRNSPPSSPENSASSPASSISSITISRSPPSLPFRGKSPASYQSIPLSKIVAIRPDSSLQLLTANGPQMLTHQPTVLVPLQYRQADERDVTRQLHT